MSEIRQWAFCICTICVLCGMGRVLFPTGGIGKLVKMLAGAVFLIAVVTPLSAMQTDSMLYQSHAIEGFDIVERSETLAEELMLQISGEKIKELIAEELKKIEVTSKKISILINTMEDNSIFISKVILVLGTEYQQRSDEIQSTLEESLKLEIEIKYQ